MKKDIILPEIADNVVTGYLASVLVSVGDVIEEDQSIIEVETDKATTDIPSSFGGKIIDIKVNAGDEIRVGQVIMVLEVEESEEAEEKKSPVVIPDLPVPKESGIRDPVEVAPKASILVPASPSVRRFARELGVDINRVKGSGKDGRISDDDVKAHTKAVIQGGSTQSNLQTAYAEVPDFSQWGTINNEPMSRIRQITAESTLNSWQTIPQVVQFNKADITELEKFRQMSKTQVDKVGGKLTMTAILLKVSALALRQFPKFNASVDMKNKQVIYKDFVNIGVAVDTPQGLLVPIVRDADKKSLTELSIEIGQLAEKARNKKLTAEEMHGGNFTISNLGGIGGTAFTPIVYPHQVAILGVSKAIMEQVYRDEKFEARLLMPLSLSYDHRLIDGADGARFMGWICKVMEQPFSLWL
ncbi:MAG: 2-oxo acid dehydrogenase subunit E2 [Bacteroidota bacterium]|nr:2-oxo acid dehydrogenase subunit E2 [Bacteroidota bacterium]